MEVVFQTEKELYERVKPALHAKLEELKRLNFKDIHEYEIWQYLKKCVWVNKKNLTLSDIVQDIIHLDHKKINLYLQNKEEV